MGRVTVDQLTPQQRAKFEEIRARFPQMIQEIEAEKPRILRLGQLEKAILEARARERRALLDRLREAREAKGLTLTELVERGAFALAAVSRLETDPEANPTVETLQRYAEALGAELVIDFTPKASTRTARTPQAAHRP